MLKSICQGANLRALLSDASVARHVGELVEAYRRFMNEDQRGTRIRDSLSHAKSAMDGVGQSRSKSSSNLPASTYANLITLLNADSTEEGQVRYVAQLHDQPQAPALISVSRSAIKCKKVMISGVTYQPHGASSPNSHILYRLGGLPVAGRIEEVYVHTRKGSSGQDIEDTFLAVKKYLPLSEVDAEHDNHRKYPLVGGKLYYDAVASEVDIIRPSAIVCHCAKTELLHPFIPQPLLHILPLDRVGIYLDSFGYSADALIRCLKSSPNNAAQTRRLPLMISLRTLDSSSHHR